MAMVRWRDDAIAMARWCDGDDAIKHRAIAIAPSRYRHRAIALSSSRHRTIAPSRHRSIAPSCHRAIVIAPSHRRVIVIAPSRHRHHTIAPSHHRYTSRWYDGAIVKCMALSGFHMRRTCFNFLTVNITNLAFTGSCFPSGMQQHCDNAPEAICSLLEEEEEEEEERQIPPVATRPNRLFLV